jgi:hypothetical protein
MINFKFNHLFNFNIRTWILFCIIYFTYKSFTTGFTFTTPYAFYNEIHTNKKYNVFNSVLITAIETLLILTILYYFYLKCFGLALSDVMFTLGQLLMSINIKRLALNLRRWFAVAYLF